MCLCLSFEGEADLKCPKLLIPLFTPLQFRSLNFSIHEHFVRTLPSNEVHKSLRCTIALVTEHSEAANCIIIFSGFRFFLKLLQKECASVLFRPINISHQNALLKLSGLICFSE